MELKKIGLVFVAALASSQLLAETPNEARIHKLVEPRMGAIANSEFSNIGELSITCSSAAACSASPESTI